MGFKDTAVCVAAGRSGDSRGPCFLDEDETPHPRPLTNFWLERDCQHQSAPLSHNADGKKYQNCNSETINTQTTWIWFLAALFEFATQTLHILVQIFHIGVIPAGPVSWLGLVMALGWFTSKRIFHVWGQYWYPWYPRSLTLVIFQRMIFYTENTFWWFAAEGKIRP